MRAVSTEFRRVMSQRRNFVNYADIIMADPSVGTLHLEPKDFRLSGNSIQDDIVDGSNFSVGTAIGKTVSIVIDNTDERFSLYDFYGAVFTLYVGLPLEDDGTRVEKVRIGQFTVITPVTTGTLISIEGVDNMYKFDKPYENSVLTYPATLGAIIDNACMDCGVNNNTTRNGHRFDNYNFYVEARPEGDFTYRQIISYVCQINGTYAKIDDRGGLYFDWMEDITPEEHADGGNYRPIYKPDGSYYTGDDLDGGTFAYNDGDNFNGGVFNEAMTYHNLGAAKGLRVSTDDIVITGVRVTNGKDADGNPIDYLVGTDDYVITVSDNPLTSGQEETVANILGTKLIGLKFRPFSLSHLQDPTIESGDWAVVTDIKNNTYNTFITNVKFSTMGYMTISCNAEPPSKQASVYSSMAARAIVKQNRLNIERISRYDQAVQRMNSLMANAMGLHTYEKTLEDGSRILYMSNKPIEDENGTPRFTQHSTVWKISGEGFALCQDAEPYDTPDPRTGCQWVNGWDGSGNVVVNSLATIGLSFDWAYGGTLTLGGDNDVNGVLSVLDKYGRERAHIDNTGVKIGHLGKGSDGKSEKGSTIYLDTEGQMQYWYDGVYSGKMRMEGYNYGTKDEPDIRDTLSIQEFDNILIQSDNELARISLHNRNNKTNGELDLYAHADIKFEDDDTWRSDIVNDGGIHIESKYIEIGVTDGVNLFYGLSRFEEPAVFNDRAVFNNALYVRGVNPITGKVEYLQGSTGWLHSKNGNWSEQYYVQNGVLTSYRTVDPVYDFWHEENGSIIIGVLGVGVTEFTFHNLEHPSEGGQFFNNNSYSVEPHIICADGVEPPMLLGISFNGTSCTVRFTAVTAAQAGSGQDSQCQMKLRMIV